MKRLKLHPLFCVHFSSELAEINQSFVSVRFINILLIELSSMNIYVTLVHSLNYYGDGSDVVSDGEMERRFEVKT